MKTVWNHKIATHPLYLAILQTKLWFCVHSCKSKIAIKHCGLKKRMKSVPYVLWLFGRTVSILNSWERQSCHSHHFRFKSLLWEVFTLPKEKSLHLELLPLNPTTRYYKYMIRLETMISPYKQITYMVPYPYLHLGNLQGEKVKLQIIDPCCLFGPR